jgi:tetratricopeptide (TPR) repeat protein/tRNA A-37 threonylcarbamoyl transferase component Bud32
MSGPDTQLMTVFSEALERTDPVDRAAYLDEACRANPELRRHVEELLAAHAGAGRFLEPAPPAAAGPDPAAAIPKTDGAAAERPARSEVATDEHRPDGSTADAAPAQPAAEAAGTLIAGRYKLLQQIGEGGMGSVWMADQTEPVKRRVAVKLIRVERGPSRMILSRFEAERQAIALMDHPHISRLLDAGTTAAGSPFFVMELVKGVPLNEYCDQHKLRIRDRLDLFTQICSAVQHAHQKGIIHRDLKPSNILVESHDGKPVPKVIDFGLAKATSALQLSEHTLFTAFGSVMGTPLYMAPEQATFNAVDVDTRADVYALGVILYELLTGTTPITRESMKQAALDELLRLIREQEAPTPSSRLSTIQTTPSVAANRQMEPQKLGRFVKGELDWIVMKALSKERDRRYETASGFARDIERFLNDEAVAAGPPSAGYRVRKFVRRYRGRVIAAGLVLLALLVGVAGTTVGLFEARRQEARANERAEGERQATRKALAAAAEERKAKETVEAVLGFVEDKIFAAARPKGQEGGQGYDVRMADAITAALPAIEGGFRDRPLIEARLRTTIGRSFYFLGKYEQLLGQTEAALALCRRELGPDHPDTLGSMRRLAVCYSLLGRHAEALRLGEEALALLKAKLGPDHPDTLRTMLNLAQIYASLGRYDEALNLGQETLALKKARLGPDHPDTLGTMGNLGNYYSALGRQAEALKVREETLALQKAKLGPSHPNTLNTMNNLANSYSALGRHAEALKLSEETLALKKARLGPDHPATLQSMMDLAGCNMAAGRPREARALLEECSAASRKDPERSWQLAALQAWFGHDEGYAATRQRILAFARETDDATLAIRAAQAGALRPSTDGAVLEAVLALGRKALGLHEGQRERLALGMAEFRSGHFAAADEALRSAATAGPDVTAAGIAAFYSAMSLFQQGKKDEAREVAAMASATMRPLPKGQHGPMAGNSAADNLILWLAYEEAKAMIGFDEPQAAPAKPDGK